MPGRVFRFRRKNECIFFRLKIHVKNAQLLAHHVPPRIVVLSARAVGFFSIPSVLRFVHSITIIRIQYVNYVDRTAKFAKVWINVPNVSKGSTLVQMEFVYSVGKFCFNLKILQNFI